jgi:hypothetical protein
MTIGDNKKRANPIRVTPYFPFNLLISKTPYFSFDIKKLNTK